MKKRFLAKLASVSVVCAMGLFGGQALADIQKIDFKGASASQKASWSTDQAKRGAFELLASFDSSGKAAWDAKKHPLVYFTSEGMGYSHRPSETNKLPGVQIIDAKTRKTVATMRYDLGSPGSRQPHGLGVSPDGKWVYIGFADKDENGNTRNPVLVINAKTLKVDKILAHPRQALHHIIGFIDYEGNERVILEFGFGADGGPHAIIDPNDDQKVVQAITYDEVRPMGHPYITADPAGESIWVAMGSGEIRSAPYHAASIARFDLSSKTTSVITEVGNHPIGIVVTSDGRYTYVAGGHGSMVYKIDNDLDEVVAHTSSAVAGPYGLRLNFAEDELYVMGKGEGSHNVGGVVGVIDLKTFSPTNLFNQPISTGGSIIDHGIMFPDASVNEMWISSAGTFETIVVDMDTNEVIDRIPTPNGGDTHSGAFVQYNADHEGKLLADHAGPTAYGWDLVIDAKM